MGTTLKCDKRYVLRVYNADHSEDLEPVKRLLEEALGACCSELCRVEFVDVLKEPERAVQEGIFFTPTLVKALPQPARRVIGGLSEPEESLMLLGILVEEQDEPAKE